MHEPRFGVVMINWNGADDTIAALDSLITAAPRPERVVVVDNGSSDDSLPRLRAWSRHHAPSWDERTPDSLPHANGDAWMLIIPAPGNLGFSGANNVGLSSLAARDHVSHFVLLNNDAMVAPDYFGEIASAIHNDPDVALIGCLIYRHPQREQIWFSGSVETPWRALIKHVTDEPSNGEPYAVRFVTGCAMVISRALYDAEGGLAEVYNPIYWEDSDYSYRAHSRGWRVILVPRARVYHRVGASGNGEKLNPRTAYFQNRNRALYVRRNYHGIHRVAALGYLIATKPARAFVELARGKPALGSAIARGFWRGMTQKSG